MILEACVNSAISAMEAQAGSADRVELCGNMLEGGCTPSTGEIIFARQNLHIKLFVMIRPRGGDFCYTDAEFEIMKSDVLATKELGADGVVFGILQPDGSIDTERMKQLAGLARPMGITCHRAFDMTSDPVKAIEDLVTIGIDRVLTSGQNDSALDGAPLIKKLIGMAGNRIIIMPGHGIKEHNFREVIKETGAKEYHLYLTKQLPTGMTFTRQGVKMGKPDLSEYETTLVDRERIRFALEILAKYEERSTI
jgi:copper homeostasis protein